MSIDAHYWLQSLEVCISDVSKSLQKLRTEHHELKHSFIKLQHQHERSKLVLISLVEHMRRNHNLQLDEFNQLVDEIDQLDDGQLDGKTTAELEYGSMSDALEQTEAAIDPRILKLIFFGKDDFITKKAKELLENKEDEPQQQATN